MTQDWLLYGANGFTGQLIARQAKARGLKPMLAGRNRDSLAAMSRELDMPFRAFPLDDTAALRDAVSSVSVVLHCAGPYSQTARQMLDACLAAGKHYLDLSGDLGTYQLAASYDEQAKRAGIMLLPAVGFDVVPTDCLAAHLKRRLPTATQLTLAFGGGAGFSRGTLRTALEGMGDGTWIRHNSKLTRMPAAYEARKIDFGQGPRTTIAMTWGDVFTAFYTTGIPNIREFYAAPRSLRSMYKAARYTGWMYKSSFMQSLMSRSVGFMPEGPAEGARATSDMFMWGEVRDDAGNVCVSRLSTPEAYNLTVLTAPEAVVRVLGGQSEPGYKTPALVFGADFIQQFPGVTRQDIS